MSGPVENAYRFRTPRNPSKVLRERRPDVIANSAGRLGPMPYPDLTPGQQALFEAQLAAYRAGIHLIRACDLAALIGQPVHPDLVAAWLAARNAWRWMN